MSRQYPHDDEIQPRFAAWLWSLGYDADPDFRKWVGQHWQFDFRAWIDHCIRHGYEIGRGVHDTGLSRYYSERQLQVVDHDEFTEVCWLVADEQRAKLKFQFPWD